MVVLVGLFISLCVGGRSSSSYPIGESTLDRRDHHHEKGLGYACALTPLYFDGSSGLANDLKRSDIRDGYKGIPFHLIIRLIDSNTCSPLEGAFVHVWHVNAYGHYSDGDYHLNNSTNGKFLRGHQVTDHKGDVRFLTIIPGWTTGEALHINVAVTLVPNGSMIYSGRLFFDEVTPNENSNFLTSLTAVYPYTYNKNRLTFNQMDPIYSDHLGDETLLTLNEFGTGYQSIISIGVDPSTFIEP